MVTIILTVYLSNVLVGGVNEVVVVVGCTMLPHKCTLACTTPLVTVGVCLQRFCHQATGPLNPQLGVGAAGVVGAGIQAKARRSLPGTPSRRRRKAKATTGLFGLLKMTQSLAAPGPPVETPAVEMDELDTYLAKPQLPVTGGFNDN